MAPLQIPDRLGAILLPGSTLFPHGAQPLHIFEPRYRQMLDEAIEGDCIFCMGTLTCAETPDPAACVSGIGTAGLIRASREHEDGRSNLLLHGLCRVRFIEWLADKPYPYARIVPVYSQPLDDKTSDAESRRLREAVESILLGFTDDLVSQVRELLDRAPDPDIMSDAVSQRFVEDPALRQKLLEEQDISRRIDYIIDHLRTLRSGEN